MLSYLLWFSNRLTLILFIAKARSSVGLNRKAVSTSDIGDLIRPIPPQITSDESSDQFRLRWKWEYCPHKISMPFFFRSFALVPQKISFQPILIETSTRPTVSVSPPSNDLNRTFTKSPEASGRLSDASDMGKLIMGDPQDKRSNSETKLASSVPSQMGFRRPLNEIRSNKLPTGGKCPPSFVATTSKPLVKVLSTSKLPGKFQPVITGVGRENRPLATSTSTYGLNGRKVV